jgi:hypothetical protein
MKRLAIIGLGLLLCGLASCAVFVNSDDDRRHPSYESNSDTVTVIINHNLMPVAP